MNDFPRQCLRKIIDKYGTEICSDSRRCEGLLNDLCGTYRREINVLVNAIEEHVPLDLLAGAKSISHELLLTRLEKRLEEQTALTTEAARWAVESWALALGITTDVKIEEIRKKSNSLAAKAGKIELPKFEGETTNQSVSNTNQPSPSSPKARNPLPPTKSAPSINNQSAKLPTGSLPTYAPANNQPPIQAQPANPSFQQQPQSVNISKSSSYFLRGCLIVILLLIVGSVVLFLGVPYAIEVMRETQRERNNEPPRFPIR